MGNQIEPTPKQTEFITSDKRFGCFSGGFGSGKCAIGGTLVATTRGLIPIENIRRDDSVFSFDGEDYVKSKVRHVINSGELPSFSLSLQGGYEIVVSDSHPFLRAIFSNNHKKPKYPESLAWTEVKKLRIGDFIAVPSILPLGKKRVKHAELIGYLLGDGIVRNKTGIRISMENPEVIKRIKYLLPDDRYILKYYSKYDYGITTKLRDERGYNYNPLLRYFRSLGLVGKNSYTKYIPSIFYDSDKKTVIDILSGLFVTDGWTDKKGIHITLMSESLIDGIRILLLKLGIISQKCIKRIKYKGTIRIGYTLSITHLQDLEKCIPLNILYKKKKLIETINAKRKRKFPQRGQDKQWKYKNNLFVRIKEINPGEKIHMYDLEISGTHNFVAENILIHNTYAGCLRSLLLSHFPGNFGLIGRLTYPELRDTTRKTFFEVCPPEYYDEQQGGQWKPSENYLKLINGSEIIFRHLDNVSEKELLSLNLGWFFIDQAEEVGERVFQILTSRLRLATVPNRYGFVVCNPEPNNWIDMKWRKPIVENKPNPDHHFIESSSHDNPYLPPDYIPSLLATYPEEMVKRYIEGRWDVYENQIYHEFDTRMHVITPFEIPKGWERIVGVDHGMVNPTAAIFAAIDYDGNIFVFDEYYSPGVVSDHARAILQKTSGQEISGWFIDPSTAAKTREKDGMPWSVIEEYEDCGLYFTPANNEQLAGINRVKEFLKPSNSRRNPITKEVPAPRLYVFKNCVNLVTEFPQYQWRKMRNLSNRNQKEQPRDFNDHALDALRYIIMSRFPAPAKRPIGSAIVNPNERTGSSFISKPFSQYETKDDELGMFHGGLTDVEDLDDLNFGQEYGDS